MAQKYGRTILFGTLMYLCHLWNSELEQQFQKDKGRVLLRRDVVKDDSGSRSAFTEKCSSTSQITASKNLDVIARLTGCARQASDSVSAYT